jgi:hypothetical protein
MNPLTLFALSLCMTMTGCPHHAPPATAAVGEPPRAPAPAPNALAPSPQDLATLLALLEEPPEAPNVYDWEAHLRNAQDADYRPFKFAERDRYIRDLAKLADGMRPKAGEILLLEAFGKGGGNGGTYQRVGMAAGQDASGTRALRALGVAPVTPPQFDLMRGYARTLLDGDRHAMKPVYDMEDRLVISYFDGNRWTTRARHNLMVRLAILDPELTKPSDLPPDIRAAINLIQVANWSLPDEPAEFGPFYGGPVEQFGEHPSDGEPLPRKQNP